jgi:hypothetical protein
MTLLIRHIRLHVETAVGPFGVDVPLTTGLNILWADNTKGKSTALQGMLYALGLERMLSAKREIPLPHVMTSYVEDDQDRQHPVLESSAWVELENSHGEIITVRRYAVNREVSNRLISVFEGPALSRPTAAYRQQDYFVLDSGAAQRESGFHFMLAQFIGWRLPTISRYDGGESLLYLETLFPLFFVEQKSGWSAIPAAFPTQFQIREVGQRALEFVLALETHDRERLRQQLDLEIANSKIEWATKRNQLVSIAALANARIQGITASPMLSDEEISQASLVIPTEDNQSPFLTDVASGLRARIAELNKHVTPTVAAAAPASEEEMSRLTQQVADSSARRTEIFKRLQTEKAQAGSIRLRLQALGEDLQKNQDAQKLQKLGSSLTEVFTTDRCPTCAQHIEDSLLEQQDSPMVMSLEDNISYIKAQIDLFKRLQEQTEANIEKISLVLTEATRAANADSARLRALKAESTAPANIPSVTLIEERVRHQTRLETLDEVQQRFEEGKIDLADISSHYLYLITAKSSQTKERLSESDKAKLKRLADLFRNQAKDYNFTTFSPEELEISEESYRPQKEGFDIGFEISASDGIRLKWAYQLAMLELARTERTNHIGFVVFDEPRQQEASKVSFQSLLNRAATAKAANQQVIFATSEDFQQLTGFLSGVEHNLVAIQGRLIKPLNWRRLK